MHAEVKMEREDSSQQGAELQLRLEGWLRKRGEKGAIKSWKKRWFILKGKKLFYYVSNTANTPKGFIDLLQTSRIFSFNTKRKDEFAFCIVAQKEGREREFYLTTLSEEERSYWVFGLTQIVRQLREEFDRLAVSGSFILPSPPAVPALPSTSTSSSAAPTSPLSPRARAPQAPPRTAAVPSFYDYLSTPTTTSSSSSASNSTAAASSASPPLNRSQSPPRTPARPPLNKSTSDMVHRTRARVHENKPLPSVPSPPARPANPAPVSTRHFKSNSDDLSRGNAAFHPEASEASGGRGVAFAALPPRAQQQSSSPGLNYSLNSSCPNVNGLSQAVLVPYKSERNLRSDELVSFSPVPTPMNSITSKLRVRPSYLMRGEEVIWGENYASRYTDWLEESRVSGCLLITNYQLIFVPDSAAQGSQGQDGASSSNEEVRVPLCSIIRVESISANSDSTENSGNGQTAYQKLVKKAIPAQLRQKKKYVSSMQSVSHSEQLVDVWCKDLRTIRLGFGCFTDARKLFVDAVRTHAPASVTGLFAFAYRPPKEEKKRYDADKGWGVYDVAKEYERIGIPSNLWRLTRVNEDYSFCKSYPRVLAVPAGFSDLMLPAVRDFRTSGRIPVAVWRHPGNGAVIVRCSQPRVGLTLQQNFEDEHLLRIIREACPRSETLFVFDARPKANAMANQAKGAGYERQDIYKNTRFKFLGIDNIHVMRDSHRKLYEQCHPFNINEGNNQTAWYSALTAWMSHIYTVLRGAVKVAATVHALEASAVVHCSDGWDRTPQIVSLAQLILDDHYRTFTGFQILIEKEWLSFGHKFADRAAHYDTPHKSGKKRESSPIFHQFLECVWELIQQYPHHFEFNDEFLLALSDHSHSGLYGTFLCNSQKQREDPAIALKVRTTSFWAHANANRNRYLNPRYSASTRGVLPQYELCANYKRLQLWREYYFRYNPAMLPFTFL